MSIATKLNWLATVPTFVPVSASDMNWGATPAVSEPRPCYPDEDAVDDHCNPNIPSPDGGGGGMDPASNTFEGPGDGDDFGDGDEYGDGFEVLGPDDGDEFGDKEEEWGAEQWNDAVEDEQAPDPEAPAPADKRRNAPRERDPRLGADEPHQFWSQDADHIRDSLPKVMEMAQDPSTWQDPSLTKLMKDPQKAAQFHEEAKRLLQEGPRIGRYDKQSLFDTMQDPGFYEKKGTQKYVDELVKEGVDPNSLGPMGDDELNKLRDHFYSDDPKENVI